MEALSAFSSASLTWHASVDGNGGGGAVVIEVYGELDRGSAPLLQQQLDRVAAGGAASIILDVGHVTFADLGAYRLFDTVGRAMVRCGNVLILRRASLAVRRLLQLVGVPTGVVVEELDGEVEAAW